MVNISFADHLVYRLVRHVALSAKYKYSKSELFQNKKSCTGQYSLPAHDPLELGQRHLPVPVLIVACTTQIRIETQYSSLGHQMDWVELVWLRVEWVGV